MTRRLFPRTAVKALIFDVDGTLYRLRALRQAIALRMLRVYSANPAEGLRTIRIISAYRHAQERLRGHAAGDIAAAQIGMACEHTRFDRDVVARCIERWMEQEPLSLLGRFVQPGLLDLLRASQSQGLRLATLSDYPAEHKLRAMNVIAFFDLVLSAQSPDVGVFKPDPHGLKVALDRLGVGAEESLYIGDRVDVDAAAAKAAGVPCVILAGRSPNAGDEYTAVSGYPELQHLLAAKFTLSAD